MYKRNLLARYIEDRYVGPLWGRRFVDVDTATNQGLRWSPTSQQAEPNNIEVDIQKGLAELKETDVE